MASITNGHRKERTSSGRAQRAGVSGQVAGATQPTAYSLHSRAYTHLQRATIGKAALGGQKRLGRHWHTTADSDDKVWSPACVSVRTVSSVAAAAS